MKNTKKHKEIYYSFEFGKQIALSAFDKHYY